MSDTWAIVVVLLLAVLVLGGIACLRGGTLERLAGLSVGGATVVAFLTVCAAAYDQPFYLDLALVLVLLSMVGQVAFAHFLEKWL